MISNDKNIGDFIKAAHLTLNILDGFFVQDSNSEVPIKHFDTLFDSEDKLDGVDRQMLYNIIKLHFEVVEQGGKALLVKGLKPKFDSIEDKEMDDQITDAAGLWASIFLIQSPESILYLTDISQSLSQYGINTEAMYKKITDTFSGAVGNMFEEVLGEAGEVVGYKGMKLQQQH